MASFFASPPSRYEGIVAEFHKPTEHYENLKIHVPATIDHANRVIANDAYLAYLDSTGSGSCIAVLPLSSYGKNHIPVSSPAYQQPLIRAHSQAVQDMQFHPFHPQVLFSVSADKLLKTWRVPRDGLLVDMTAAEASLQSKAKAPLRGLATNPAIEALLAVRSSREISLFDTLAQREVFTTSSSLFAADLLSLAWSRDGKLLSTTSKNKRLSLLDLRVPASTASAGGPTGLVESIEAHSGVRFSSTTWLGDATSHLLSFGHNALTQHREVSLWDVRALSNGAMHTLRVDKEDGALLPHYDPEMALLSLSGQGDKLLRVFHVDPRNAEDPLRLLCATDVTSETHANRDVVRGLTALPKQCAALGSGEVLRLLKMGEGVIQTLSLSARSVRDVDHAAAVRTAYGAPPRVENSLAAWLSGESLPPAEVELAPTFSLSLALPERDGDDSATAAENGNASGDAENEREKEGVASRRASTSRVVSGLQSVWRWRHMHGREAVKDRTYFGLTPDLSALESPIIAANDALWAIPHRGGGGPIYVSRHSAVGKVLPDCATLNAHKASVQEISFSPFHAGLMASGSFDCTIKLWDVEGLASDDGVEPRVVGEFAQHTNSVRTCCFHPTVSHLLCSTGQDATLRFFDTNALSEVSCLRLADASSSFGSSIDHALVSNLSFNYEGNLVALACRDRNLRLMDARQQCVIASTDCAANGAGLGRNLRVAWCARSAVDDPLVTVSSGAHGLRQIALWDARSLASPVTTKSIDNASGALFPLFDEGLNAVFVAGKGDTIVRAFEIASLFAGEGESASAAPEVGGGYLIEKCCELQTSKEPIAGICMLPKRMCDVRSVEVARLLKLTADAVVPLHFRVPRADHLKDFFHDDIYPPVRAKHSEATVDDWLHAPITQRGQSNAVFAPIRESLRPEDMQNVSERVVTPTPSASRSKIAEFQNKIQREKEEEKEREDQFARLQQMAWQNAQYNRNLSGPVKIGGVVVNHPVADDAEDSDDNWDD